MSNLPSDQMIQPGRGVGNTTRQMQSAPQKAVFVCGNQELRYTKDLARKIGREDIEIVSPDWLSDRRWAGRDLSGIVLDHAAALTDEQWSIFRIVVRRGFEEIERLEAQWRAEHDAYIDAEDEIECLVHDVEQLTKAVSAEATRAEQLRAALKEKEERLESWYRTEAQIRCALLGLIEEDVYLKAIELIGKKSTDHNPHLSGDSSAPETKATVELAADTIRALMERHNFRHPLMSELGDLIRETFRMGVDAGRCYHSPQETTVPHVADLATGKHPDWCRGCAAEKASEQECRSAGPSGNAAGTGPVDTRAEARLSRREVTAQKAPADCTGCGGKPEFPNIPCSICGRYPDGTSV